ncbi:MAG: hypothetical protein Q8R67_23045 [Rhodoferax sp.]|nr:hypothetical protein [Rhodoferax sp.]MDP3654550.1 hypothetical protein [Rhodoferax sp.]
MQEALAYIERNYLTLTTIKHPDRAESTRFWNFALSDIEAALQQSAKKFSMRDEVCIWVDIGYHSIQMRSAGEAPHSVKSPSTSNSLLIRVPAHPLARAPRQEDRASRTND